MRNKVFKAFCKVPMNLQLFAEGDGAGTGDEGGNGGGAGGAVQARVCAGAQGTARRVMREGTRAHDCALRRVAPMEQPVFAGICQHCLGSWLAEPFRQTSEFCP